MTATHPTAAELAEQFSISEQDVYEAFDSATPNQIVENVPRSVAEVIVREWIIEAGLKNDEE